MLSVISLLSSDIPNTDSPANVDAAVSRTVDYYKTYLYLLILTEQKEVRENLPAYQKKVRRLAQRSADTYFELLGNEE